MISRVSRSFSRFPQFSRFSSSVSSSPSTSSLNSNFGHSIDNIKSIDQERKSHNNHTHSHTNPSQPVSTSPADSSSFSVSSSEVHKFSLLSSAWWRFDGPFAQLHRMQNSRVKFIREAFLRHRHSNSFTTHEAARLTPFIGHSILDVGCGGGILAESLARMGGIVTGIDASKRNIGVAEAHKQLDSSLADSLDYRCLTAELLAREGKLYDLVASLEVVEHVENPRKFIETLCNLVKPGGTLVLSTLNRSQLSYWFAVVAAESRLFNLAPRGTHDWNKFLTPEELTEFVESANFISPTATENINNNNQSNSTSTASATSNSSSASCSNSLGFQVDLINGQIYNPITNSWSLSNNNYQINYILSAKRKF